MGILPHEEGPTVAVVPVGDPPTAAVETVADTLRDTFDADVHRVESVPADAVDGRHARTYLDVVGEVSPGDGVADIDAADGRRDSPSPSPPPDRDRFDHRVGVTPDRVDVVDGEAGVFGAAVPGGADAVLSTYAMVEGARPTTDREFDRVETETLALAGRLFDLRTHREDDGWAVRDRDGADVGEGTDACAMTGTDDLAELDAAPAGYCGECRARLAGEADPLIAPRPDLWTVMDPETDALMRAMTGELTRREKLLARLFDGLAAVGQVGRAPVAAGRAVAAPVSGVVAAVDGATPDSARDLPRSVHTLYRTVRFWGNLALYALGILAWLVAIVWVLETFLGGAGDLSDAAAWTVLATSVVLGVASVFVGKAVVAGLLLGVLAVARGVDPEELD